MATYDEVMQALRNADAAGDTEAATRLAQIAVELTPKQVQPSSYGFGSAMLQGLSFGFSDEAQAKAMEAAGQGTYEQNLASIRAGKEAYEQEFPYRALGAEILGSIPTMALGGIGAVRGLQAAQRVLPSITVPRQVGAAGGAAATGAATGALTGAGTAQPGERMEGARIGAQVGAVLGAGGQQAARIVPQVPGIKQAIEFGREKVGLPTDFARRADVKLLQALQRDGVDLNEAQRRISLIKQGGYKPETIIELGGENTRRLADLVSQYPGASQAARELAETRSAGAPERIITDFREAFRVNADAFDLSEQIIQQRNAVSRPLYERAYQEGGVIADERFKNYFKLTPFKDAYKTARELAEFDGVELPEKIDDLWKLGGPDLRTLDYIKRGLDDVLYVKKGPTGGTGKQILGRLEEKRREFVDLIDEVGPLSYREARRAFAGPTEVRNAIDIGKEFTKLDPRELKKQFDKLSPAEQEGFKVGVFDSIRTNIEKGADGVDVLRRVWKSTEKQNQLRVLLGEDAFSDLSNRLVREKVIRETDVGMMRGSQTQPRMLLQREFEGRDELIPQIAERGVTGATRNYLLRSMTGPGQPTAEQLARTLYSLDLPTQQAAIQRLQSLDEILTREAARSAGVAGTAGGLSGLLGD
jgi:hypothetical protein